MSLFPIFHTVVILLYTLRSSSGAEATTNEFEESHAVVTVTRGIRSSPDTFTICSRDTGPLSRYFQEPDVAKTMECNPLPEPVDCHGRPELKERYRCECKPQTQMYLEAERRCENNAWFRQGCSLRFGSWHYKGGWSWNKLNDPLLSLYFDHGFAITGSYNLTKDRYTSCTLTNVSMLNQAGKWESFDLDKSNVRVYTMRQTYQISWQTSSVNSETKAKISGKIFRFYLTCNPVNFNSDYNVQPLISCLAFKATGNATFVYAETPTRGKSGGTNTTAVALGVVFALLAVIAGVVLGIFIFRRRQSGKNVLPTRVTQLFQKT